MSTTMSIGFGTLYFYKGAKVQLMLRLSFQRFGTLYFCKGAKDRFDNDQRTVWFRTKRVKIYKGKKDKSYVIDKFQYETEKGYP